MQTIPLTKGEVALVDDDDFDWLQHFTWIFNPRNRYAYRNVHFYEGSVLVRSVTIYMHRLIMEPCDPFEVDHKNGNRLDNRKQNLRLCTHAENTRNRAPIGKYKGVSFDGRSYRRCPWRAAIGKQTLGVFATAEEAAKAYNDAAIRQYGQFARLNDIAC